MDNDSSTPAGDISGLRPVDQTSMYDPETGSGGDCLAACIATITGLPIDEASAAIRAEDDYWWNDTVRFLKHHNWRIYHAFPTEKGTAPAGVSIMCGRSPREVSHATVAIDGVMVHDPHPSREGIGKPTAWFVLVPFVKVEAA